MPGGRCSFSLRLIAVAIASTTSAGAQNQPADAAALQTAPVVIDGVTLFRVRGVSAFPAERRAAEIASAIRAVGANRALPPESITVRETPLASLIHAGDRRVFPLVDADAELEGVARPALAQAYRNRVADAVVAYRADRQPGLLWNRVWHALLATAVFVILLTLGARASRRIRTVVVTRYRSRVRDVQFKTIDIVRGEQLWHALERALRAVVILLALIAGYMYLNYVLVLFPWTRGLGYSLSGILLRPLATLATGFIGFVPSLIFLIVLAIVARSVSRLARAFFRRVGDGSIVLQGFESDWALPAERIFRLLVIVATLVIAYPYIPGSGSEAFKGIGLLLGLMFSLGSPSVIGNSVAGLSLAFRRAFRVGDRVRIGEHAGYVSQVRLLTTYLRSFKNEEIVIPNSLILNSEVVNFSTLARDRGLILHTNVGIGYETPWRQVEAMLLEAARRTSGLLAEPEPYVLQKKLGDFAVDYEINGYCNDARALGRMYTALHRNILDVFNEYGVQIMTPAYEGDPEQAKIVPREQWFTSPATAAASERVVESPRPTAPADVARTPRPSAGDVPAIAPPE